MFRLAGLMLATAAASVSASAAQATRTDNLLVNGDAEVHRCTDDWTAQTPVPGWQVLRGAASVLCYSAFASAHEIPVTPPGASAGSALFSAPGADTAMEQVVDVSAAAESIDGGAVGFELSAWLGGWRDRPERAMITSIFLDAAGHATSSPVVIDGASAATRARRTGLFPARAQGTVPRGTRQIVVTLHFPSGLSSYHNAYADNLRLELSGQQLGGLAAARSAPPLALIPPLDHVAVVMMENTNYSDVVRSHGRSVAIDARMPFLAGLAEDGVILTNMWANYHPSDQNYVAMVAGDTYRYGPVYFPDYNLPVTHLGDLLEARGKRWRAYVQNMGTPCNLATDTSGQSWYAPDDQPFVHFQNVIGNAARCVETARDLKDFQTAISRRTLPDFAWIAADGWWDGEGAWWDNKNVAVSVVQQDAFLKSTLKPLIESAEWKHSRSLLIVTWDESLGWGWPDNRVATVMVGSPGLLRAGAVLDAHYDGYSVLRTVESGLGLDSLGRFDQFASPLNAAFSGVPAARGNAAGDLRADESAATRGSIKDTFGRVTTPAAVVQGETLALIAPADVGDEALVNLEPLGRAPDAASKSYTVDPRTGIVSIATTPLRPGQYGAWLRRGSEAPHRAPLPVTILPPAAVSPEAPGVEIVGAPDRVHTTASIPVREDSNLIVRYCQPAGAAPADGWIGIFTLGTPPEQMTRDNADVLGFWLRTPGTAANAVCGEAMAFAAELTPGQDYQMLLFELAADGTSSPVGRTAAFTLTPALP